MYRFWETIIRPIFDLIEPKTIVEIGSGDGRNTGKLVEYCAAKNAILHAIDPAFNFDIQAMENENEGRLIPHRALSLEAMQSIDDYDVVLIDGDHNWYTVFNELKLIEAHCGKNRKSFPLVFFHDIGWPYGRRDLYYNPDSIPEQYRKPCKKLGMRPGVRDLVEDGGANTHLYNATYENDPRSGVLTAVEDFLDETTSDFELFKVPGFHTLGVLVPLLEESLSNQIKRFLGEFCSPPEVLKHFEALERFRIEAEIKLQDMTSAYLKSKTKNAQAIENLQKVRSDFENAVSARDREIEVLKNTRDSLRDQIDSKNLERVSLKQSLKAERERTVAFKDSLRSRDHEIDVLGESIEKIEKQAKADVADLERVVSESRAEASELAAKLEKHQKLRSVLEKTRDRMSEKLELQGEDIVGKAATIRHLSRLVSRHKDEQARLLNYIDQLDQDIKTLLETQRWKVGNALGDLKRRLLWQRRIRPPSVSLVRTLEKIRDLRKTVEARHKATEADRQAAKQSARDIAEDATDDEESYLALLGTDCNQLRSMPENEQEVVKKTLTVLANKRVTIVVPVYNGYEETKTCIESIERHTSIPYKLTIVDDCSTDEQLISYLDELRRRENVTIIHHDNNKGFVESANDGMSATDSDVLLLNSDTEVTPRWLQKLIVAAYSSDKIATVTPFSNAAGAFSVPEIGVNRDIEPFITVTGMAHVVERVSRRTYPEVPTGNGFCMYIKRAVLEDVGYFDHERFKRGYCEENDFCMRALKRGWKHVIDDSTFIFHKRAVSFSKEKAQLEKKNRKILNEIHPEYSELVRQFTHSEQIESIRKRIRDVLKDGGIAKSAGVKRLLYVLHEGTGGTPATSRDLIDGIDGDYDCYLLTCDTQDIILRHIAGGQATELLRKRLSKRWSVRNLHDDEFEQFYFNVLVNLNIELVHIRHLFKHSFDLPEICFNLGIPVILSFHDFYFICPSFHLLDGENKYCGGHCSETGHVNCRIPTPLVGDLPNLRQWLPNWRAGVERLFEFCDMFVTTSEFAKSTFLENYPALKQRTFKVIEHGRDFRQNESDIHQEPGSSLPVNILVPGNIDVHKGSLFIRALRELDRENKLEFHFLGTICDGLRGVGVEHGRYNRDQFCEKVTQIKPSFVAIFSIWPETYCHTLSEAWSCGIPVLASDIGTIKERVVNHGGGWLLDYENPAAAYQRILDIIGDREEYGKKLKEARSIQMKPTRVMAREYELEYRNVFLQRATKTNAHVKTLALATKRGAGGYIASSYIRTILPLQHPRLHEKYDLVFLDDQLKQKAILRTFIESIRPEGVVVQRDAIESEEAAEALIASCREHRIPIVFEIDDDLLGIDNSHPEYRIYKGKSTVLRKLCKRANAVTVSTVELKDRIVRYNERVFLIGNCLDEQLWFSPQQIGERSTRLSECTIGYMGTVTHENDLALLKRAITSASDRLRLDHGTSLRFEMIGGMRDEGNDDSWYTRIKVPERCSEYPKFVRWLRSTVDWDIAVAPLQDSSINRSKSELKYLEYTALGAAGIYSSIGGYAQAVTDGSTGYLVDAGDETRWEDCIVSLAVDRDLRKEIVKRAREHIVGNYLMKDRVVNWLTVLDAIMANATS